MTVAEQAAEGTTQEAVHTRALIIGTGFSGLGHGHRAAEAGRGLPDPGEGRRGRRHLAGQHLPGLRVRRAVAHVLVLVRAESRLAAHVFSYQPEIFDYLKGVTDKYGLRRHIRFEPHVDRAHWDDAENRLARFHHGRPGVRRAVPRLRRGRRCTSRRFPTSTVSTNSPAPAVPLRAVGPHRRPDRQAGGGDRNRSQRDPDRARDRRRSPPGAAVPAHPAWVSRGTNNAFPAALKRAFSTCPGLRAAMRAGIYWTLEAVGHSR